MSTETAWIAEGAEVFVITHGVTPSRTTIERVTKTQVTVADGRKFRNDGTLFEISKSTSAFRGRRYLAPITNTRCLLDEAEGALGASAWKARDAAEAFRLDSTEENLAAVEAATKAARGALSNRETAKRLHLRATESD